MITKILLLLTVIVSIKSEYVNYQYHKVYTVTPTSEKEVQDLLNLKNSNDFVFWIEGIKVGLENRIDVAPEQQGLFENYVSDAGIKAELIIEDVQSLIDNQVKRSTTRNSNEYAWDYYQNLDEIYEWMNRTAAAYSSVASVINIGTTAEGRPIFGMVIDFKKRERPYYGVIEGGLHAREWISPATCTWIIKEFLTSNDRGVRAMAEDVVWYIFPVTNPDGYVYSFTDNRMWRKNRNPAMQTSCAHMNRPDDMSVGVDLNRNFDFLWMTVGASGNPCDITYAGPSAFSEAESLALANLIKGLTEQGSLLYYLSYHSYTQLLLVPYSHVRGSDVLEADNYADLFEIGIKGMDKLTARHNTTYRVGTSADILYEVSGSGFDWAKGGAHFPIVFLFELRDTGRFGFLLPPEEIIPNNEETMDGMVEMDRVVRSMGYYRGSAHNFAASGIMILLLAAILVAK